MTAPALDGGHSRSGQASPRSAYLTAVQQWWQGVLTGSCSGPAGEWDRFILLALRFGWSEQQIWQSSPDFLDELIARLNAEEAVRQPPAPGRVSAGLRIPVSAERRRAKALAWARSQNAAAIRQMSGSRRSMSGRRH